MKNYLVTGASKGLGYEIVKNLLEHTDSRIYAISRTVGELARLMSQYGGRLIHKSVDLSNVDLVRTEVFRDLISNDVVLHGFVNNAALAYDTVITNLQVQPLRQMYDVNVLSPMVLTKYAIRNMLLHQTKGSIVHISSVSVHTGYKGLAMYASTKGALEAFSKNTAREWGSLGIRSNCVVAGFMETDMTQALTDDQKERIYQRTSLKSAVETESVAAMVAFLLSDRSTSMTGQNIFVDNGTI